MDINIIEEQLKKIPEEIKKAFFSIDVAKKIYDIGSKSGLQIDQSDALVEEVGYTMIGLKPSTQFVQTIGNILNINEKSARRIADEINTEVFSKIRTSMREMEEKERVTGERQNGFVADSLAINTPPMTQMQSNSFTEAQIPKPSHISDLEKAGGFTIEDGSGPMVTESFKEPLSDHLITGTDKKPNGGTLPKVNTVNTISSAPIPSTPIMPITSTPSRESTPFTPIVPTPLRETTPIASITPMPTHESAPMPPSNLPTAESVEVPKDIPSTPPIAKPPTIPNVAPTASKVSPPTVPNLTPTVKPKQSDVYREPI